MRLLILRAIAALAVFLFLGAAFWLTRPAPESVRPEARQEDRVFEPRFAPKLLGAQPVEEEAQVRRPPVLEEPLAALKVPRAAEPPVDPTTPTAGAVLMVEVIGEEDSSPLAGVPLFGEPSSSEGNDSDAGRSMMTDEFGRATFYFPPGEWRIYAWNQRDRELVVELAQQQRLTATLRLRSRADLNFNLQILDAVTGEALAGAQARVRVHAPKPFGLGVTGIGLADEDGCAVLRLPSWSRCTAEVALDGYAPAIVQLEGSHADRQHALEVRLSRGARMEGVVLDGRGAPVEGARVTIKVSEQSLVINPVNRLIDSVHRLHEREWTCTTLADGRYGLNDLVVGINLSLAVVTNDLLVLEEKDALQLEPGEVRLRDLRLQEPGSIKGVLLGADGEHIARQPMELVRGTIPRMLEPYEEAFARTVTNAEGLFTFCPVPPGTWLVGPAPTQEPAAQSGLPLAHVVELPPGEEVEVELRLPSSFAVTGRCLGPDGELVANVMLSARSGTSMAETTSADDGSFLLAPLAKGEVVIHSASLEQYASGILRVQAGDRDVLLQLARASRIHGIVVDEDGTGLEAEVLVSSRLEEGLEVLSAHGADLSGAFEIRGLSAGRFALVARTVSGLVSPPCAVSLAPGEEVFVELRVGAGARVRLLLPDGAHPVLVRIDGSLVDRLEPGETTSRPFRPGAFTVELEDAGVVVERRESSVAAGEVVEVDLR